MENIVSIKNLVKSFGKVQAVKGIDLEVKKGEVFGFLGPNGAGKTTTLRMLTTLLPPDEGSVIIDSHHLATHPHLVRQSIGYVGQKGGADLRAKGRENLLLQGRLYGLSGQEAKDQSDRLIDIFDLSECIDRLVSTYSGGQQRRLEMALGMMNRPRVLFLDEPTTGLDPQNRYNLWKQLQELNREGTTLFVTSHYLEEVDFLAHRLAIMDHGQIVAIDTPDNLKQQISGEIVELGFDHNKHIHLIESLDQLEWVKELEKSEGIVRLYVDEGPKALPHILRLLDQQQVPFETVKLALPSLNDVFLKKTGYSIRKELES